MGDNRDELGFVTYFIGELNCLINKSFVSNVRANMPEHVAQQIECQYDDLSDGITAGGYSTPNDEEFRKFRDCMRSKFEHKEDEFEFPRENDCSLLFVLRLGVLERGASGEERSRMMAREMLSTFYNNMMRNIKQREKEGQIPKNSKDIVRVTLNFLREPLEEFLPSAVTLLSMTNALSKNGIAEGRRSPKIIQEMAVQILRSACHTFIVRLKIMESAVFKKDEEKNTWSILTDYVALQALCETMIRGSQHNINHCGSLLSNIYFEKTLEMNLTVSFQNPLVHRALTRMTLFQ